VPVHQTYRPRSSSRRAVGLFPAPEEPAPPDGRVAHPYFMHDMILREPSTVEETLRAVRNTASALPELSPDDSLYLIGQGTSFHAALATEPAAEMWLGPRRRVRAIPSFDAVLYEEQLDPSGLAIVFSASGETAITIRAQETLARRGISHLLITHSPTSPSAERAPHVIATRHAEETSWTHTASYVAAIAAAWGVFERWSPGRRAIEPDLIRAVGLVRDLVDREDEARAIAETIRDRSKILLLGSGPGYVTAREAALKFREAAGRFAAAVGVEEALHGPLPAVDDTTAVIALALGSIERERAETALRAASIAGARTVLIARGEPATDLPTFLLPSVPPVFSPLVDIIPFQWMAYWTGVMAGRNPDIMGLEIPRLKAARSSFGI
jgi:glutamine---fructose-6-phosphate transaminase (isomerizing)